MRELDRIHIAMDVAEEYTELVALQQARRMVEHDRMLLAQFDRAAAKREAALAEISRLVRAGQRDAERAGRRIPPVPVRAAHALREAQAAQLVGLVLAERAGSPRLC